MTKQSEALLAQIIDAFIKGEPLELIDDRLSLDSGVSQDLLRIYMQLHLSIGIPESLVSELNLKGITVLGWPGYNGVNPVTLLHDGI